MKMLRNWARGSWGNMTGIGDDRVTVIAETDGETRLIGG